MKYFTLLAALMIAGVAHAETKTINCTSTYNGDEGIALNFTDNTLVSAKFYNMDWGGNTSNPSPVTLVPERSTTAQVTYKMEDIYLMIDNSVFVSGQGNVFVNGLYPAYACY